MITRPWEKSLNVQQSIQSLQNLQHLGACRPNRENLYIKLFIIFYEIFKDFTLIVMVRWIIRKLDRLGPDSRKYPKKYIHRPQPKFLRKAIRQGF